MAKPKSASKLGPKFRRISIDLPTDTHRAIKQRAIDESVTMITLIRDACARYVGVDRKERDERPAA